MINNDLRDKAIANSKFLKEIDFRIDDFKMSDLRDLIDERKRAEISELRKTLRENRNNPRISEPHYLKDFYWCSQIEFIEAYERGRVEEIQPAAETCYYDKITRSIIDDFASYKQSETDRIWISGNLRLKGDFGNAIQRIDESEPTDYWWSVTIYLGDS
tara:strand:- start:592 stop:1068 length:477 start_codon:yes stop_codon:yes gene_type:complete